MSTFQDIFGHAPRGPSTRILFSIDVARATRAGLAVPGPTAAIDVQVDALEPAAREALAAALTVDHDRIVADGRFRPLVPSHAGVVDVINEHLAKQAAAVAAAREVSERLAKIDAEAAAERAAQIASLEAALPELQATISAIVALEGDPEAHAAAAAAWMAPNVSQVWGTPPATEIQGLESEFAASCSRVRAAKAAAAAAAREAEAAAERAKLGELLALHGEDAERFAAGAMPAGEIKSRLKAIVFGVPPDGLATRARFDNIDLRCDCNAGVDVHRDEWAEMQPDEWRALKAVRAYRPVPWATYDVATEILSGSCKDCGEVARYSLRVYKITATIAGVPSEFSEVTKELILRS